MYDQSERNAYVAVEEWAYTSEKEVLEHQAIVAKLGAYMGLRHQFGSQGPCGHQVLQL